MRKIHVNVGNEYRTSFVDIYQKDEFLYPEYRQAACCIDEIVSASCEYDQVMERSPYTMDCVDNRCSGGLDFFANRSQCMKGYPNNIVAFCAKRGQGKTTCMLSVSKALALLPINSGYSPEDQSRVAEFWDQAHKRSRIPSNLVSDYSYVRSKRFYVIDPIDPSAMEQRDSVLRTIFLRMENEANSRLKNNSESLDPKQLITLRDEFADAYRKLKQLKRPISIQETDQYDDLTQLAESGDSVSLKNAIMELINKFLKAMGYDMLVIQIDDSDLNTSRAYEIVEDIRNYCVGPHVIVLMALHLGTLRNCIEQEYVQRYQYLLRTDYTVTHMEKNKCREMAERYIDKLIPGQHQIHLPYFDDFIREGKSEIGLNYTYAPWFQKNTERKNSLVAGDDLQQALMELVYRKTGIVLMPPEDYYHNLLPRRFRELTHMLSFFSDMDDIIDLQKVRRTKRDDKMKSILISHYSKKDLKPAQRDYLDQRLYNLDQFETYLIQHWGPSLLDKEQTRILENIANAPNGIVCKKILDQIKNYLESDMGITNFLNSELKAYGMHPPFSTVCKVLDKINRELDFDRKYELTYAIRILFSVRLHQCLFTNLKNGSSLQAITEICGAKVFGQDPFVGRESLDDELISVSLLRKMVPINDNLDTAWGSYFEPVSAIFDDGKVARYFFLDEELLKRSRSTNSKVEWETNDRVEWILFDVDNLLFDVISDKSMEQEDEDYYSKVQSVLMVICNYDMQHRVSKYVKYENVKGNSLLRIQSFYDRVKQCGQKLDQLFSDGPQSNANVFVPEQGLPLGCNFTEALSMRQNDWSFRSVALELARPRECLNQFVLLLEKIHKALLGVDLKDTEWNQTIFRIIADPYGDDSVYFDLLKKVDAFSTTLEYCWSTVIDAKEPLTEDELSSISERIGNDLNKAKRYLDDLGGDIQQLVKKLQDPKWLVE